MTRDETKKILAVLKTAYPYFYGKQTDAELSAAVNLWYAALGEFEYSFISAGLKTLVRTAKFPPTVAGVLEAAKSQPDANSVLGQPYSPLYLRDTQGNALRGKDGHFLLNTRENRNLLEEHTSQRHLPPGGTT